MCLTKLCTSSKTTLRELFNHQLFWIHVLSLNGRMTPHSTMSHVFNQQCLTYFLKVVNLNFVPLLFFAPSGICAKLGSTHKKPPRIWSPRNLIAEIQWMVTIIDSKGLTLMATTEILKNKCKNIWKATNMFSLSALDFSSVHLFHIFSKYLD